MTPPATAASVAATVTPQLALWCSEFGANYTERNDVERPARIDSLRTILAGLAVEHALEVGCNVGWNLRYLRTLGVPRVWGIEPQRFAVARARARDPELDVFEGTAFDLPFKDRRFDLVFTSGVLIHIGPAQLGAALAEMARVSKRYLLTIEYDHDREIEIAYRGHDAALWKRDHAAAVRAHCPGFVRIRTGFLRPADGYDDCTYHVFERSAAP
ncbi:MAG: methyltransferase domain-containing protein [Myxococcales bacterium]|nr:methyltransferase domain-containing protein [Myxococcales bacterium]